MTHSNHITTISGTTELFAAAVLVLLAGALISLITAHLADRSVNPVRDAVSDYGAGAQPWPYRLTAVWTGTAALLLTVALGDAMFPKPTVTILFLLLFTVARWVITIFPVDLPGAEPTSTGRSHTVMAALAFGAIALAALTFTAAARPDEFWVDSVTPLSVISWATAVLAVLTGVTRALKSRIFGLVERLLYLAMFGWMALVATLLLTGS